MFHLKRFDYSKAAIRQQTERTITIGTPIKKKHPKSTAKTNMQKPFKTSMLNHPFQLNIRSL